MSKLNWHLILGAFVVLGLIVALYSVSFARDLGQWTNSDPAIREYYEHLMQPDSPTVSCCGAADAYWADEVHVRDGKVFATITDDRDDAPLMRPHVDVGTEIEIPNNKMKFGAEDPQRMEANKNPTGHGIVFLSRGGWVYCFVAPSGV